MKTNRTKTRRYAFRRTDNGEVVWVDWKTMMTQSAGFITIKGTDARRCVYLEGKEAAVDNGPARAVAAPVVSDSLGFAEQDFENRKAQLQAWGCKGIEFKRDPQVPEFYQVHAASEKARDEYARHRNMVNRTGSLGGGLMLSEEEMKRAEEIATRHFAETA